MHSVGIPLSQGQFAAIDAPDIPAVNAHKWHAVWIYNKFYACATVDRRRVYMHRFLMGFPAGMDVDHRDGDGLNNRRSNLRVVTHQHNIANQKLSIANTSGYKGVSWDKARRKWSAYIKKDQKRRHLGLFVVKEDAARAYDAAARELFGEHALLNLP